MEILNDTRHYTAPDAVECESCGHPHDPFIELDECDDCGEECCLHCSTGWFEYTICYECIDDLYRITQRKVKV